MSHKKLHMLLMPPLGSLVVTKVLVTVGKDSHVGACGTVVNDANNDHTLPLGAWQEFCISVKLATASPVITGHTLMPSLNVLPNTTMSLPVAVVPDAPQKANCPRQICTGSADAVNAIENKSVVNSCFMFIFLEKVEQQVLACRQIL
jgi:hypothetical protein